MLPETAERLLIAVRQINYPGCCSINKELPCISWSSFACFAKTESNGRINKRSDLWEK